MLSAGREVRDELQTLQREVVMCGELQQRSRDTLTHLARAVHHTAELSLHHDAYIQQIEGYLAIIFSFYFYFVTLISFIVHGKTFLRDFIKTERDAEMPM